jgi:hypothetical protein
MLRLAHYRCERCGAKRTLEVHHRTYERLGRERDADLEVLCGDCHEVHHLGDPSERVQLYIKLATEVVRANPWAASADMAEALKVRCAQLRIPYDSARIARSLSLVCGRRAMPAVVASREARTPDVFDPSKIEARELLHRLGLAAAIKTIPTTPGNRLITIDAPVYADEVLHDRY